jgi:serine protease Do
VNATIRKTLIAGGFAVAVVAAATGIEAVRSVEAGQAEPAAEAAAAPVPAAAAPVDQSQGHDVARELSQAFRNAAGRAASAVVYVEVTATRQVAANNPFRFFFDEQQQPQRQRVEGSGSGFIFRADGYILTNNHVIEDADKVRVRLQDGREFAATIKGRDPVTDVAVIKIEASDLPTVQLGDSDEMEVGDWVVALGYPLNLGSTATAGIVSAKGRSLGILDASNPDAPPLEHFIQTDAAINRGNSGGPLVDLNGNVIGINSAISSQTGFYTGYGFAVPSNIVKRVADDLIQYGEFRRPRLGVRVGALDLADLEVYKLTSLEGAEVVEVQPNTPAEKAGLRLGDVVVGLDGQKIRDNGQLTELLARYRPGAKVTLDVMRYGRALKLTAELTVFEGGANVAQAEPEREARGAGVLGFAAADLNVALARRFQIEETSGVIVTEVDRFGPAAGQLGPGLIIEQVNGKPVRSVAELEKVAETVKPGEVVSIIGKIPGDAGGRRILNYRIER